MLDVFKSCGWAIVGLLILCLLVLVGWAIANIGAMLIAFIGGVVVGSIAVVKLLRKR